MTKNFLPTYNLKFNFHFVPPVMKRGEHVIIVVQDHQGNYILGSKNIYPKDIYRFIGGGTDNQPPLDAAARELEEELGNIQIDKSKLQPIAIVKAAITETSSKSKYSFSTHMYSYKLNQGDQPTPQSDLDDLVFLDKIQMEKLIDNYSKLPKEVDNSVTDIPFSWSSYGDFYGQIHLFGLNLTKSN